MDRSRTDNSTTTTATARAERAKEQAASWHDKGRKCKGSWYDTGWKGTGSWYDRGVHGSYDSHGGGYGGGYVGGYGGSSDRGWKREHGHANSNPSRKAMHCTNCEEAGEMEHIVSGHDNATCGRKGGDMGGHSHRECTEKQRTTNNLHYSKEKHKFEEAQRGGARKAKTACTEDDEDYVNHTGSTNTEDSSPMEGFVREGEGTDAALERHLWH
jgi:hypothetical protein